MLGARAAPLGLERGANLTLSNSISKTLAIRAAARHKTDIPKMLYLT